MIKRFPLKARLSVYFGLLFVFSMTVINIISIRTSRLTLKKMATSHLITLAENQAAIFEQAYIQRFKTQIEALAREAVLVNADIPMPSKVSLLESEAEVYKKEGCLRILLTDIQGNASRSDGSVTNVSHLDWFKNSIQGEFFLTSPYSANKDGSLVCAVSTPIRDTDKNIIGVIAMIYDGLKIYETIKNVKIGDTGEVYILDKNGVTIADHDISLVYEKSNSYEKSKTDKSLESIGEFEREAVLAEGSGTGSYKYEGDTEDAAYAKIPTTGWTIIATDTRKSYMVAIRLIIIVDTVLVTLVVAVIFGISLGLSRSLQKTADALKEIAHGSGDLTVSLTEKGKDEITDISRYFNQTIGKIAETMKSINTNASEMEVIGGDLADNMVETAGAVRQITATIESVKEEAISQAASVSETASTVEQIIKTIRQLNASIEMQADSVAQSSSSVEEMTANIASVTGTLEKSGEVIHKLSEATTDGKATVASTSTITQKISDESGSLMEASSVIQHIASQTNLLAMNAAIEAAHAGEAGKGFAVVADEIRKLAEDSAAQGKNITSTLKNLSGEIETLSASSKTVEEKFNIIFSLADQVKSMSLQITEAMREQEKGSGEVLTAIKNINDVTLVVKNGSAEILNGSGEVVSEMRKLDEITRTISNNMNEMASGAVQINEAVQEVNEISQKNKMRIGNLAGEVKKFKV